MIKNPGLNLLIIITTLYKARPALDSIKKFKQCYFSSCNLAVDKTMAGLKGKSHLKQCMPRKPTKWGTKG
jgi:hypothetical protein